MPALPQAVTGQGFTPPKIPFANRDFEGEQVQMAAREEAETTARQASADAERAPMLADAQRAAADLSATANKPVDTKPLPEPTAKHLDPKQISEAASIWMTLGAFAGLLTRQPMTAALGNMTAAMQGAIDGDEAQFKHQYEEWKTNFDSAMRANKAMLDEKREILEDKKMSLTAKQEMIRLVDLKNGAQALAQERSWDRQWRNYNSQLKLHEQSQQRADALREAADRRIQAHEDRVAAMNLAHEDRVAMQEIARERAANAGGAAGGKMGQREMAFAQRVLGAANQASRILANVVQLPLESSTGVFGDKQPGVNMLTAPGNVLARQMTPQDAQTYQVMATGIQRSLAAIETMGLAPPGTLSHQMESVILKEGDTNLTKMHKLADIRQIVEAGMETLSTNPRIPDDMRHLVDKINKSVQESVPFTQSDVIGFSARLKANPKETLGDYMKRAGAAKPTVEPGAWSDEKERRYQELKAKHGTQ